LTIFELNPATVGVGGKWSGTHSRVGLGLHIEIQPRPNWVLFEVFGVYVLAARLKNIVEITQAMV
jgi:predicted transcriptional regulator with HTH domain